MTRLLKVVLRLHDNELSFPTKILRLLRLLQMECFLNGEKDVPFLFIINGQLASVLRAVFSTEHPLSPKDDSVSGSAFLEKVE